MEVITDPIPHIISHLDKEMYEYCKTKWISGSSVNNEKRYNIQVRDTTIQNYINLVSVKAFQLLKPYIQEAYPKWAQGDITIRQQFSGNLCSSDSYQMRDWHLDNGNKVLIGLWYFKHPEDSNEGGLHISDGKNQKLIPYDENTIVFIPNLPNAWHKVGSRKVWTHERRFINIVAEQQQHLHDYSRDVDNKDSMKSVKNLMA